MSDRALFCAAVALLLTALACKPPAPDPARAASTAALSKPEAERARYRVGFMKGAAMPSAAVQARCLPVLPSLSSSPDELDAVSGLCVWDLSAKRADAEAQGLVDGFAWAEARQRALPNPVPAAPGVDAFEIWAGSTLLLRDGGWSVALDWQDRVVRWAARYQGFAPVRGWREVSTLGRLKGAALTGSTLWIDGENGLWALDIPTSALRRIAPPLTLGAPPSASQGSGLDIRAMAERGDAPSMIVVGEFKEQNGAYDEARHWYARAASASNAKAMEHLAAMAALGRGGPVDKAAARRWLEQAQALGDKEADDLLQALEHPEKLQIAAP